MADTLVEEKMASEGEEPSLDDTISITPPIKEVIIEEEPTRLSIVEPSKEEAEEKPVVVVEKREESPKKMEAPETKPVVVEEKKDNTTIFAPGQIPQVGMTYASLLYSTENNGELFIKWSETPLPGSLANFATAKKIPPFKLKKQLDILKNVAGSKKKFYEGLAAFFKEADMNDGIFTVTDASEKGFGDVWVSVGGKKWGKEAGVPRRIRLNESVDINTIEAVAILPHASAVYEGILKIDIGKFVNTAQREGSAWHRA
jgi:hypothetical protein